MGLKPDEKEYPISGFVCAQPAKAVDIRDGRDSSPSGNEQ
jgi:hypothetical protein